MKIVSLVPSLTELLYDLGLGQSVAGRTRFCIHPKEEVEKAAIIGGTKNPKTDRILELAPDLIIANREENRREDVELLQQHHEVCVTEISTVDEALKAITSIGDLTGTTQKARKLEQEIRKQLDLRPQVPTRSAAYLIWKKPWMTIGSDTYIHDVMQNWGLKNVFGDAKRYPEISLKDLRDSSPEVLLLSSEPYPFSSQDVGKLSAELPRTEVMLVNGEFFSWYGSRMLPAFRYLNAWRKALGESL